MGKITVPTTVTAPDEITIPLVRGDYMGVSNVFRLLFEFALTGTGMLGGVVLSIPSPTTLHFVFLCTTALASVVFGGLTLYYHRQAGAPGRAARSPSTGTPASVARTQFAPMHRDNPEP